MRVAYTVTPLASHLFLKQTRQVCSRFHAKEHLQERMLARARQFFPTSLKGPCMTRSRCAALRSYTPVIRPVELIRSITLLIGLTRP